MIERIVADVNLVAVIPVILLVAAAITYVLRDWERATALTAAGITGVMGFACWRISVAAAGEAAGSSEGLLAASPGIERFGFALHLHADALPPMVIAFGMSMVALVMAARFSQGRGFVPMTLGLLAIYCMWYLLVDAPIESVLILPLGLIVLSALSAIGLQAGRPTDTAGPLRWMVAPVLAFPLFLVANWYIAQAPLNPQDTAALRSAAGLLTFGLLLLLAPVPLHSMQPATAETAPPMATALFSLLYQLSLIYLVSHVVLTLPWMSVLAPMNIWFSWAGLVTALWAGMAAIGASHPGRLWGYLSLHDWGLIILLLSVPGLQTWPLVAFIFVLRVVSSMTAATGLTSLEAGLGGLDAGRLRGAGMRMPWSSAAYLLGGLGLVGFPLSAGFAGHWAALQLVAASDWRPAAAVLVASGAAILALIRMARTLFGPIGNPNMAHETWPSVVASAALVAVSVALAISPQLLNGAISRAILAFGV